MTQVPRLPPQNVITPTTKAVDHDVPISPQDIVKQGLMSQVGGLQTPRAAADG